MPTTSPTTVADLLDAIRGCEGLTTLQLNGNSYGVEAMKAIGETLAEKPLLSRAVWFDMFVSRLRSEIPPALVRHSISCDVILPLLTKCLLTHTAD